MARLIYGASLKRRDKLKLGFVAEERFARLLEAALPDDVTVYWSVDWLRTTIYPGGRIEGEADFVVFDPHRGILCLELKSGHCLVRDGAWIRIPGNPDRAEETISDPMLQAKGAQNEIRTRLRNALGTTHPRVIRGIALTDCDFDGETPVYIADRAVTAKHCQPDTIADRIAHIFVQSVGEGGGLPLGRLPDEHVRVVRQILGEHCPTSSSIAYAVTAVDRRIVRMDREQRVIGELLAFAPEIGVRGGPGTGKTLLAKFLAARCRDLGRKTLFLCHSNKVIGALATELDGVTCSTAAGFLYRLLGDMPAIPTEDQLQHDPGVELLFQDRLTQPARVDELQQQELYDSIVIDEGQDLPDHWYSILQTYCGVVAAGRIGNFIVFYDHQQNIFHKKLAGYLEALPHIALHRNMRNSQQISDFAYRAARMDCYTPCLEQWGTVPEVVRFAGCDGDLPRRRAAARECLSAVLARLTCADGIKPEEIAVLSVYRPDNSLFGGPPVLDGFTFTGRWPQPGGEILFSTVQGFKGLETKVVVLCDLGLRGDQSRALNPSNLLVGMTRARSHLVVIAREGFDLGA